MVESLGGVSDPQGESFPESVDGGVISPSAGFSGFVAALIKNNISLFFNMLLFAVIGVIWRKSKDEILADCEVSAGLAASGLGYDTQRAVKVSAKGGVAADVVEGIVRQEEIALQCLGGLENKVSEIAEGQLPEKFGGDAIGACAVTAELQQGKEMRCDDAGELEVRSRLMAQLGSGISSGRQSMSKDALQGRLEQYEIGGVAGEVIGQRQQGSSSAGRKCGASCAVEMQAFAHGGACVACASVGRPSSRSGAMELLARDAVGPVASRLGHGKLATEDVALNSVAQMLLAS
ncbi:MAG: hypothetical protein ACTJLL_02490 [Anaplasma sp.]